MSRYLISHTHEPGECLKTFDSYLHAGAHYLTQAEWGCDAGVHAAWLIVEADNDNEALLVVPPIVRTSAQLVRLTRYTPEQLRALHRDEMR